MSMILGLSTLSDASIGCVLATPALIWCVVAPDDPNIFAEALGSPGKQGFFARLFGKKSLEPVSAPELELAEEEVSDTDLDKAWHGIHFLLTGSDWEGDPPLNFLVSGGIEVGDVDVGYGPARVFRSSEVAEIHNALSELQEDDLRARFRPDVMMKKDIYPTIWDRDSKDDDTLGYLFEYFAELKKFVGNAAGKGLGLVVTLQ
ncbi:MAG: YfbM family protein [Proteobacteria bacterium]|nr:YfbM family protein [Pseudomonadota bacterium]